MKLEGYLKKKYSPTSVKGYVNMIKRFKGTMGGRAGKATYKEVLDYIGFLRKKGLHPKSLRNNLFAIKIYFDYLLETGTRDDHPCRYLKLKDQTDRQIQMESLYPKERLEAFYENCQAKHQVNQRRDKIIIGLLVYQALTVGEIINLKKEDINLEEGTIKIRGGKGRVLSLNPKQVLLLHGHMEKQREGGFLLVNKYGGQLWTGSVNRIVNRGRPKEERLLPSKIRQSVIAHLLKEKNDLRIVQAFAGHRRTASTEAYKQTGLEELKTLIDKLHPLG